MRSWDGLLHFFRPGFGFTDSWFSDITALVHYGPPRQAVRKESVLQSFLWFQFFFFFDVLASEIEVADRTGVRGSSDSDSFTRHEIDACPTRASRGFGDNPAPLRVRTASKGQPTYWKCAHNITNFTTCLADTPSSGIASKSLGESKTMVSRDKFPD